LTKKEGGFGEKKSYWRDELRGNIYTTSPDERKARARGGERMARIPEEFIR